MKKRNKKILNVIKRIIVFSLLFLFSVALYSVIWDWISNNEWVVLIITGTILFSLLVFGVIKFTKIKKFIKNFLGF
jgi:membrane protein YdbS with pleckstrin-like domain